MTLFIKLFFVSFFLFLEKKRLSGAFNLTILFSDV